MTSKFSSRKALAAGSLVFFSVSAAGMGTAGAAMKEKGATVSVEASQRAEAGKPAEIASILSARTDQRADLKVNREEIVALLKEGKTDEAKVKLNELKTLRAEMRTELQAKKKAFADSRSDEDEGEAATDDAASKHGKAKAAEVKSDEDKADKVKGEDEAK